MLPLDTYPIVTRVITEISEGQTESSACLNQGISVRVFRSAIANNETLRELYDEAQQLGYDRLAEILLDIDNDVRYGSMDPKMARVKSDNIKWLLEKRKPKEYGQKVQHEVNVTADNAIIEALARGQSRAQGQVIDGEFSEVKEIAPPEQTEEAIFLASIGAVLPV